MTNCRYGKCVERREGCEDGEVVQDITANGDLLVMKCCAVLDLLSEEGSEIWDLLFNQFLSFVSVGFSFFFKNGLA